MYLLEVEPLDLGEDVKAIGLELIEPENREPVRGAEAAQVWSRVLPALSATEPWAFDFFSHPERVQDYCGRHGIAYRTTGKCMVIEAPEEAALPALLERFAGETFGVRSGGPLLAGDGALEGDLARRGVDAYHQTYPNYFFCAVCDFENGFLTLLTTRLWASEVIRRVTPVLADLEVEVRIPR
ncbi:MAG: hypothetical protein M1453_06925 [Acidobacteria bacterium]|nr:hypothetical protein [Acidobacteriota bacterium]MCL5287711.1 hypothetical protein [Acidobacteriota bacterium]